MKTIEDIIQTISERKEELGITLYTPASSLQIEIFEKELNIVLPEDIKQFYKFSNGFKSAEDIFRIIDLEEILDRKKNYKPNQFYVAEYMVYCDMWEIVIDPIINGYSIQEASLKTILTNSFAEFLEHFLTGGVFENNGLYDWKDQICKSNQQKKPI
jgi:hypothetical protein